MPHVSRLAYILAASHSGSTLLAMLLGAHPDAMTVGELKATNMGDSRQYRCSCGCLIAECGFWIQVGRLMEKRGIPGFDITRAGTSLFEVPSRYAHRLLAPLYREPAWEFVRDAALSLSPAWHAWLRQTQIRNTALVEALHEISGARLVVDSSKIALRLKYLLRNPALDIKVIRMVRDGRAVSLTYTDEWSFADASNAALRGGGSGVRRVPPRQTMRDAAREWRRSNEASQCLVERLPAAQWIQIHYEELCANPGPTLRRLCEFLGLDPARINLNFRSRTQHVIGNGMRFDQSSEIRLDERWRGHLTAENAAVFDSVGGDLNRRYGYV
jgi:hypothetical protein